MINPVKGRLFLDPSKQHDDMRLLRRAINKRWDIPDEFKGLIVGRLKTIITQGSDEIALKAIAEIRHLELQNQKDEHKVIDVKLALRNTDLDEIASDLGIEISVIEDASRKAGISFDSTEVDGEDREEASEGSRPTPG
jgi:hypothetical protein